MQRTNAIRGTKTHTRTGRYILGSFTAIPELATAGTPVDGRAQSVHAAHRDSMMGYWEIVGVSCGLLEAELLANWSDLHVRLAKAQGHKAFHFK